MNRRTLLRALMGAPAAMKMGRLLYGAKAPERIEAGGATLDVYLESDQFDIGGPALLDWVRRSAKAVTAYFGRFPVPHARVRITVSTMGAFPMECVSVTAGRTAGSPSAGTQRRTTS